MFEPFGTPGTNLSAHWHPEPRGRGTFNILSTCLTTMILCVWTAVHLNIPEHNGGTRQKFLRKPGWLLLALLAPEIVVWNAWEQRKVARELMDAIVEACGSEQPSPAGWVRRAWAKFNNSFSKGPRLELEQEIPSGSPSNTTMVHGFYAAMGGFAVQSRYLSKAHTLTSRRRFTLSHESVFRLLRMAPEVFPDLDEDEILDKSKASTLVKALTCLQALWFCLQCTVRLTMNTSISLLELNVFGHCICTFIIYALWWNKPMEVSEPTFLRLEVRPEYRSLIALLCLFPEGRVPRLPPPLDDCFLSGNVFSRRKHSDRQTQPPYLSHHEQDGIYGTHGLDVHDSEKQIDKCAGLRIEQLLQFLNLNESDPHIKVSMYEKATPPDIRFTVAIGTMGLTYFSSHEKLNQFSSRLEESGQPENSASTNELSADDYRLEHSYLTWLDKQKSCASHLSLYTAGRYNYKSPLVDRIHDWTIRLGQGLGSLVDWYPRNTFALFHSSSSLFPQFSALAAAALVYGGLHLLAWNAPFHTPFASILWKISGITIASLGLFPLLIILFSFAYRFLDDSRFLRCLALAATGMLYLILVCLTLLYVFARVYLVVESFLSLAYLPESALITPNFSLYFPHIG